MAQDDTSWFDRRDVLKLTGAGAVLGSVPAEVGADGPRNPLVGFGGTACKTARTSDENLPFDTEGRYGGWGGHEYHCTRSGIENDPVVFVHGNTHDACDFAEHATQYLKRGYRGDELWSITFRRPSSTHPEMRDQLDDFVRKIRSYTGTSTVDIVSHSLGVTGARFWMDDRDRYGWVGTFVGLAGANHGTYTCGPRCASGTGSSRPCGFISPACAEPGGPLYDLNHPDETPGGVAYYTIRGGEDEFYLDDPDSPVLAGALENVRLEGAAHNATRASQTSIDLIYGWVTDPSKRRSREPLPAPEGLAASGSRTDDGSVFTAGQTDRIGVTVTANDPVFVRDTVPYEWNVLTEYSPAVDCVEPHPHEGVSFVHLTARNAPRTDLAVSYLVEAPDATGTDEFGPVEVRPSRETRWVAVEDTTETNAVVGADTSG